MYQLWSVYPQFLEQFGRRLEVLRFLKYILDNL